MAAACPQVLGPKPDLPPGGSDDLQADAANRKRAKLYKVRDTDTHTHTHTHCLCLSNISCSKSLFIKGLWCIISSSFAPLPSEALHSHLYLLQKHKFYCWLWWSVSSESRKQTYAAHQILMNNVLNQSSDEKSEHFSEILTSNHPLSSFDPSFRCPMPAAAWPSRWWQRRTHSPRVPWSPATASSWTMAPMVGSLSGKVSAGCCIRFQLEVKSGINILV